MEIDTNNLSMENKQLIKQYDDEHKIKGSFSKFMNIGVGALIGSVVATPLIAVGADIAQGFASNNVANPVGAAIALAVVAVAGVGIPAVTAYLGKNIYDNEKEKAMKAQEANEKLSPEELVNKKISVMSKINAIREKAESEENQRRIQKSIHRTDTLINIAGLTGFR